MKKLLILMLVIFSPSTIRAGVQEFFKEIREIQIIELNKISKTNLFKVAEKAHNELFPNQVGKEVPGIFFKPLLDSFIKMGLAFEAQADKNADLQKKASYADLLRFREEIISLLTVQTVSWSQQSLEFQCTESDKLFRIIQELKFPGATNAPWYSSAITKAKNWVTSIFMRTDEDKWDKEYVSQFFFNYIDRINDFIKDDKIPVDARVIAYIYREYVRLLQYMIPTAYGYTAPLTLTEQIGAGLKMVGASAAVGAAAYAACKLRSIGSAATPTAGQ